MILSTQMVYKHAMYKCFAGWFIHSEFHLTRNIRKLLFIALSSYAVAYIFYFIYTVTRVTYTRREFSKRDLSDGPLVLKEGVAVGKSIAIGKKFAMSKKAKVSEKKQSKLKKRKWKISTKHNEPLPKLDEDFIKVSAL
ncbi:unnamed protein product [Angiostrongylus costaricensis]|uniref:60S ribosomal protein L6 n=1 Tax=Angiostrongylus costaricensis TaxID=334426 RepID=A0A0R3PI61_ANGCS|nr:unnamed protein product [Angiostrongylus costaricensis]